MPVQRKGSQARCLCHGRDHRLEAYATEENRQDACATEGLAAFDDLGDGLELGVKRGFAPLEQDTFGSCDLDAGAFHATQRKDRDPVDFGR